MTTALISDRSETGTLSFSNWQATIAVSFVLQVRSGVIGSVFLMTGYVL